jgi:hypothetical protein
MSNGPGSQTICAPILILALALQAMTPEACDLCSATLLKWLTSPTGRNLAAAAITVPDSDDTTAGNSLPLEPYEQDDLPDEMCLPGASRTRLIVHRGQRGPNRPAPISVGVSRTSEQFHRRVVLRPDGGYFRYANVFLVPGRLNC